MTPVPKPVKDMCDCGRRPGQHTGMNCGPRIVRRSPVPRKARAKVMPRCKECGCGWAKHPVGAWSNERGAYDRHCARCRQCPGYQPKPTAKQKKTALGKLQREAARLWSKVIKHNKRCVFLGGLVGRNLHVECKNGLQAMHLYGKKSYPAVRYDLRNGVPGCGAAHSYYTHHAEEFGLWMAQWWGPELLREMTLKALSVAKLDMAAVVEGLRAELARLEA